MSHAPRILFFGYSEVGYECLSLLLERGDNVVALITHEDNPNEKIWFKTPAVAARKQNVPTFTPDNVNTPEWRERIAALKPDLILSVYYRHMIGTKILAMPPLGAFNMHGSLLPKYRGRAPINWAVLHGEPRLGMTLHRMVKDPDAGAIVDQEGIDIAPRDTAEQAFRKVLPCARLVLARQIDPLLTGTAKETPQDDSQATYFTSRKPEDLPAFTVEIIKQLKALGNDRRLKIIALLIRRVSCTVGEIAESIHLSFRSTSRHLQLLRHAGFIEGEQIGLAVHYRLRRDHPLFRALGGHLKE